MSLEATQALSSFSALQAYFNGDKAIAELKKKHGWTPEPLRVYANLNGRWYVCQVTTAPFRVIIAVFIYLIGKFIAIFHRETADRLCWYAKRLMVGCTAYSTEKTKVYWLQKSVNWPQKGEASRFNRGSMPISIAPLEDQRVRDLLDFPHRTIVSFQHDKGICSGISVWFLTLYLRTQALFKNKPRAHVQLLTKLFKEGGPKEAVFLQSFFLREWFRDKDGRLLNRLDGAFLGIKVEKKFTDIVLAPSGFFQKLAYKDAESAKRTINKMSKGAYVLRFPGHQTVFIKINNKLGFFMDPNEGGYMLEGPDLAEKLLELSRSSLNLRRQKFNPATDVMRFYTIKDDDVS